MIISAGPTNSSLPRGCSPWLRPGSWRANPDEETTDWRAVCGRTARTVRRAGTAKAVSDPYRWAGHRVSHQVSETGLKDRRSDDNGVRHDRSGPHGGQHDRAAP